MKIALIGRPGRIIEKGEVVFTSMPRFDAPSGGQAMAVFTQSTTTKLLQRVVKEKQKQATE